MIPSERLFLCFMLIIDRLITFLYFTALDGQIVQFKLSDIGEGITEVTVKDWWVKGYAGKYNHLSQIVSAMTSQDTPCQSDISRSGKESWFLCISVTGALRLPESYVLTRHEMLFTKICAFPSPGMWKKVTPCPSLIASVKCKATKPRWPSPAATMGLSENSTTM